LHARTVAGGTGLAMDTEPAAASKSKSRGFDPPAEAEWHRMISEAAYFLAERRAFAPGNALEDWLRAEQEIKALLGGDH